MSTSEPARGPLSDQVHALERELYELRSLAGEAIETFQVASNRDKLIRAGQEKLIDLADDWKRRLDRIKAER